MPKTKSTKKFESKHLKDTIKRRKEVAKVKQKHQLRAKQKARRASDRGDASDSEDAANTSISKVGNQLKDMSVDEFFQSGFDIPEKPTKKRKRTTSTTDKRARKSAKSESEDDESNNSSEEDSQDDAAGGAPEGEEDSASESEDDVEHTKQLEALAEKDPEFYKYLKENDSELLAFEEGDFAELELSEDETPKKKRKSKGGQDEEDEQAQKNILTNALITKWAESMSSAHSLRSTREVILAFRAAAHLNDDSEKEYKYTVTSSDAYNKILIVALKQIPEVLNHHAPLKESASGKVTLPTENKKLKSIAPMVKSHIASVLYLLTNLTDSPTIRLTLASILDLLPYTLPYRKVLKELGKRVVGIWSDSSSDEATKIAAFLVLRRLVVIGDAGIREAILKATYQGLVRGSRNTTVHTIQGINVMKNSAAELWGVDQTVGYTTGFGFVRQLAIHLRTTITNKTKDSYKAVYNWQCVHSLDFWSRVLAQNCSTLQEAETGKESQLKPLIYPTVQVTLGIMRLIPTAQYFPLRFQLFRALLRISRATHTYIPLAPTLYEVLTSAEMRHAPKPSAVKSLDFNVSIRAGKALLRTRVYQDGVGEQVVELFSEFFALWCKSIAFPELALPVVVMLKRWIKEVGDRAKGNKNGKVNTAINLLIQKIEANTKWIEQKRSKVDYAPNNRSSVEKFLADQQWEKTPLGAYVSTQRVLREQRAKLLLQGQKEQGLNGNRAAVDEDGDEEMASDSE